MHQANSEVFLMKTEDSVPRTAGETSEPPRPRSLSRRQLMRTGGAAAAAFTIVPRHVLGGAGFVAPSEKITLACIGFGTQAIREIGGILASPDVQIVAVCDVEKDGAQLPGMGQERDPRRNPATHREPDLERRLQPRARRPRRRQGDRGNLLREAARPGAVQGMCHLRRLPRAAGQREGCDGRQGDDARITPTRPFRSRP